MGPNLVTKIRRVKTNPRMYGRFTEKNNIILFGMKFVKAEENKSKKGITFFTEIK